MNAMPFFEYSTSGDMAFNLVYVVSELAYSNRNLQPPRRNLMSRSDMIALRDHYARRADRLTDRLSGLESQSPEFDIVLAERSGRDRQTERVRGGPRPLIGVIPGLGRRCPGRGSHHRPGPCSLCSGGT